MLVIGINFPWGHANILQFYNASRSIIQKMREVRKNKERKK